MPTRLSAEAEADRRALLARCVEEGWPVTEIIATHGISQQTIQKYHPGYKGMDWDIRNEITALKRKVYALLRSKGYMKKEETL